MKTDYPTAKDLHDYEYYMKSRPHVVLLGAGASCAAIPNGDKNGKKISAMSGFIEKFGLTDILEKITLHTSSDNMDTKQKLEEVIHDYMLEFKLPDSPTVYDYLIMGLTSKDLIA